MGTVYSTLGARLDVGRDDGRPMQGADRDLVPRSWQKMNAKRFDHIMLKIKTVGAEATPKASRCSFEGPTAHQRRGLHDLGSCRPWAAAPTAKKIGADKAGVAVNRPRLHPVDIQMRTNVPHIFAIGDIVGQPMLAHKAVHRGARGGRKVAARCWATTNPGEVDARVIPSVAYTDPEVAWVGSDRPSQGAGHRSRGLFPWDGFRPLHRQRPRRNFTKLLFDALRRPRPRIPAAVSSARTLG